MQSRESMSMKIIYIYKKNGNVMNQISNDEYLLIVIGIQYFLCTVFTTHFLLIPYGHVQLKWLFLPHIKEVR